MFKPEALNRGHEPGVRWSGLSARSLSAAIAMGARVRLPLNRCRRTGCRRLPTSRGQTGGQDAGLSSGHPPSNRQPAFSGINVDQATAAGVCHADRLTANRVDLGRTRGTARNRPKTDHGGTQGPLTPRADKRPGVAADGQVFRRHVHHRGELGFLKGDCHRLTVKG